MAWSKAIKIVFLKVTISSNKFFRIHEATGIDMSSDVYEMLGYDEREKKVRLGVLAENTHTQIKDKLSQLLKSHPEVCITHFFDIYSLN